MKFKRSQFKLIFLSFAFLLIMAFFVYALGTASVVPLTPDGTWTNLTTNTSITFRWSDVNDVDIHLADCVLYINVTETGLFSSDNEYGRNSSAFANITNSSAITWTGNQSTEIFFNRTYGDRGVGNNTAFYWGVKCTNLSSSPTTGQTIPRVIYQDLRIPQVKEVSKSFSNNTWVNSDIRIEINVTDNGTTEGMHGDLITCEIINNTRAIASSTTGETSLNGTNLNITNSSLIDGVYSNLKFGCRDPAGNINTSFVHYNISMDQTTPLFSSFNNPTPAEGSNQSSNNVIFNFTIEDTNIDTIIIEFDGANATLNLSTGTDCNTTLPFTTPVYCNITNSSVVDKKDYAVRVYVNDSAGNVKISSTRTFSVSNGTPLFRIQDLYINWTIEDSLINYTFQLNSSTPASCRAFVTDRHGVVVNTTVNGEIAGTIENIAGNTAECKGQITTTNIGLEGAFTVNYNFTDGIGRSNQTITSKAGVLTRLFAGWNIITYPDGNKSAIGVCNEIEECSKVAWFNNTIGAKSFVTFSNSTISVNNGTDIPTGEAIYVYVNSNSWAVANDYLETDITLQTVWNFSLSVPGWNLVGLLHNVSMNTTYNVEATNASLAGFTVSTLGDIGRNLTYASMFNSSASTFYSCKRSLNKCSGTSVVPYNINLPKGKGVWMLPKNNITINRSTIVG